jgi:hypothetical protein
MLGEKEEPDGYTPESYKRYEAAYNKIVNWIENHKNPEAITQERIDGYKGQAVAKLEKLKVADDELNLDDDEEAVTGDSVEDTTALDEAKAKAKETLGEKKAADASTEESYATYSANYDKILAAIEGAESVEALEAFNIAENKTKNEELLVEKTTEEEPSGTDVDSEEEEVDTEIGTEDEESAGEEKISEISDDRLIKLYQVLSGRQISSNAGVAKSQLKRLRQKLASLGESIDNNSSDEELLEVLQSEAEAVKSLKDTAASLKATASSMQNMTSAMKEEYHKYANPAELTAMDNLKADVDKIVNQVITDLVAAGYDDLDYYDSDCYMSGNNTCTITMFIGSEDTFEAGETEDLQDHMANQVEEALAQIKLPPEIVEIQGGAMFPDNLIMDEDDAADGITRGEITVEVTFARNLM